MEKDKIVVLTEYVSVEFVNDNTMILKGDETSFSVVKEYIDGFNLMERSVILPHPLVMYGSLKDACKTNHCRFNRIQSSPESKF